MNQTQLDGITKSRLAANIALAQSGADLYADDAVYLAKVCSDAGLASLPEYAADSYCQQFAGKTVQEMELELVAAVEAAMKVDKYPEGQPVTTVDSVPTSVEMVQARLALLGAGITSNMVEAVIDAMPEPQCSAARIEWEFRPRVRRQSTLALAVGAALKLTDEQIDDLFRAAAKL